jgi:cyclopropane-fatty-acyl-phospholipid synthase
VIAAAADCLALGAATVAVLMLLLWLLHLRLGNAAVVDPGWAASLALLGVLYALRGGGDPWRATLIAAMAAVWGVRLALHLLFSRVLGRPEEGRYVALRQAWGGRVAFKFLLFFQFQALIAVVLSVPLLLSALNPAPGLGGFEYAGLLMWGIGLAGEAAADRQLERFKSDPANRGRTCQVGLWRFSRHPNYFFEWLVWVGFAVFALGSPYGSLGLLAPLLMLYFLLRVTGIPATEAQALRTRGEEYRRYQQSTSAFVPWFPKPPAATGGGSPVRGALLYRWLERDLAPDWLIRLAIGRLVAARLRAEQAGGPEAQAGRQTRLLEAMRTAAVSPGSEAAREQHYEVPAAFFELVLGPHLKYSCGLWRAGVTDLAGAEAAMLELTCCRARLADGQDVLELGCGWGSLTLFMAARHPRSRILAVSNSASQKRYIEAQAARRGLANLEVVTADMNRFETTRRFDRIVSVEMFEHMRNWEELLRRAGAWARPGGLLFVHIFSHLRFAYPFEVRAATDWMAEHFFTGGLMPSHDLPLHFQEQFRIRERWLVDGEHYRKTAEAWLARLDRNRAAVLALFASVYGSAQALRWLVRWRVFFLACAGLFGFAGGAEWMVSHYLFERRAGAWGQPAGLGRPDANSELTGEA